MADADTVFDLFTAFQIGAPSLDNLKFQVIFLTPLIYLVAVSK